MADTRESRLASRLQQARSSYASRSSTGAGAGSAGKKESVGGVPGASPEGGNGVPGGPSLASRSDEHGSRASRGVNPIATSASATAGSVYNPGTAYGSGSGAAGASGTGPTGGGASLGLSQMRQARASFLLDSTPDRNSPSTSGTVTASSASKGRSQFSQARSALFSAREAETSARKERHAAESSTQSLAQAQPQSQFRQARAAILVQQGHDGAHASGVPDASDPKGIGTWVIQSRYANGDPGEGGDMGEFLDAQDSLVTSPRSSSRPKTRGLAGRRESNRSQQDLGMGQRESSRSQRDLAMGQRDSNRSLRGLSSGQRSGGGSQGQGSGVPAASQGRTPWEGVLMAMNFGGTPVAPVEEPPSVLSFAVDSGGGAAHTGAVPGGRDNTGKGSRGDKGGGEGGRDKGGRSKAGGGVSSSSSTPPWEIAGSTLEGGGPFGVPKSPWETVVLGATLSGDSNRSAEEASPGSFLQRPLSLGLAMGSGEASISGSILGTPAARHKESAAEEAGPTPPRPSTLGLGQGYVGGSSSAEKPNVRQWGTPAARPRGLESAGGEMGEVAGSSSVPPAPKRPARAPVVLPLRRSASCKGTPASCNDMSASCKRVSAWCKGRGYAALFLPILAGPTSSYGHP